MYLHTNIACQQESILKIACQHVCAQKMLVNINIKKLHLQSLVD